MTAKKTCHGTAPLWKDYDLDLWRWRLQTLEDLVEFEAKHGPTSAEPLPPIQWELGTTRKICADLPSCEPQSLAVLGAFAAALGTSVQVRRFSGRVLYSVHGRIGKPEGTDRIPRTGLLVRTWIFHDKEENGRQTATSPLPEASGRAA